jgi:hypothetical protein
MSERLCGLTRSRDDCSAPGEQSNHLPFFKEDQAAWSLIIRGGPQSLCFLQADISKGALAHVPSIPTEWTMGLE